MILLYLHGDLYRKERDDRYSPFAANNTPLSDECNIFVYFIHVPEDMDRKQLSNILYKFGVAEEIGRLINSTMTNTKVQIRIQRDSYDRSIPNITGSETKQWASSSQPCYELQLAIYKFYRILADLDFQISTEKSKVMELKGKQPIHCRIITGN